MTTDLDALEALAKAATPGPYKVTDLRDMPDGNRDCIWIDVDREDTIQTVAEIDDEGDLLPIWGIDDARYLAAADPSTVLALIAELRQERERADERELALQTVPGYTQPKFFKQEFRKVLSDLVNAEAALSRAEETIEKLGAIAKTCPSEMTVDAILTEYDKQKEADHG